MKNNEFIHSGDTGRDNTYEEDLAIKIMEQASHDLRKACKHDIRAHRFDTPRRPGENTGSLMMFFSSPLAELCCGKVEPWYIVNKIFKDLDYPFQLEAKEIYDKGREYV